MSYGQGPVTNRDPFMLPWFWWSRKSVTSFPKSKSVRMTKVVKRIKPCFMRTKHKVDLTVCFFMQLTLRPYEKKRPGFCAMGGKRTMIPTRLGLQTYSPRSFPSVQKRMSLANYLAMMAHRAVERHQSDTMQKHKFKDWWVIQRSHLNANSNPLFQVSILIVPEDSEVISLWGCHVNYSVSSWRSAKFREPTRVCGKCLLTNALSAAGPKPLNINSFIFKTNRRDLAEDR